MTALARSNPTVADMVIGLNDSQRANAKIIEREFNAAGFGPPVVAAAIINAIAESGLRNDAKSPAPEDSVGLFQLNARGGGRGMSTAERMDPAKNTRRIIEEAKAARGFMNLVNAGEKDVKKLAAAFSTYVERPADKPGNEIKRAAMVDRYFGAAANKLHGLRPGAPMWLLVGLPLTTLGVLGLALYISRRRRDAAY